MGCSHVRRLFYPTFSFLFFLLVGLCECLCIFEEYWRLTANIVAMPSQFDMKENEF
eukprot:m.21192 g.21192  ORF g.21192 m.21192 type:complete len:56 (+) comp3902_c0_seq1:2035-2202(+)